MSRGYSVLVRTALFFMKPIWAVFTVGAMWGWFVVYLLFSAQPFTEAPSYRINHTHYFISSGLSVNRYNNRKTQVMIMSRVSPLKTIMAIPPHICCLLCVKYLEVQGTSLLLGHRESCSPSLG